MLSSEDIHQITAAAICILLAVCAALYNVRDMYHAEQRHQLALAQEARLLLLAQQQYGQPVISPKAQGKNPK